MTRESPSVRQSSRISSFARQNTCNTSSFSRGSRQTLTSARTDAKRRVNEVKQELENVLHVLDNGVNRTPVPLQLQQLQRQQHLSGLPLGSAAERESVSGFDMNNTSMLLQSSILFGNDLLNTSRLMLDSSFASSSQVGFDRKSSMFNAGTATNLEMSSRSISSNEMKGLSPSSEYQSQQAHDRKRYPHSSRDTSANANGVYEDANAMGALGNVAKLFERQSLWEEIVATSTEPPQRAWNELEKRSWRQGATTITLKETPTLLLYAHQDESVPNDNQAEVHAVQSRNEYYSHLVEEHRCDEGTKFQSRSTTTFAAPKKSVYCEAHPPCKKDTGPLQVTPWMLKDEFAALLGYENEDDDDEENIGVLNSNDPNAASAQRSNEEGENDLENELIAEADTETTNSLSEDQTTRIGTGTSTNTGTNDFTSNSLGLGRIASSVGRLTDTRSSMMSPSVAASNGVNEDGTSHMLNQTTNNYSAGKGTAALGNHAGPGKLPQQQQQQWMFAESFLSNLRIMERAVVQNYMEKVQLAYRGIEMNQACERMAICGCTTTTTTTTTNNNSNNNNNNKTSHVERDEQEEYEQLSKNQQTSIEDRNDNVNKVNNDMNKVGTQSTLSVQQTSSKAHAHSDTDELSLSTPVASKANERKENWEEKAKPGVLPEVHVSTGIKPLWCYRGKLTQNRTVTCMAWNRKEPDILAVGYSVKRNNNNASEQDQITSSTNNNNAKENNMKDAKTEGKERHESKTISGGNDNNNNNKHNNNSNNASARSCTRARKSVVGQRYSEEQRGLICCWSLKNPLAPELVLHLNTDAGVTALSFSQEHPSLLAVGNTEGYIVIYDVLKDLCAPSIVPSVNVGLHTGAVWELKWVARGKERGEFLMSISADGRVVQWAVGKSIERVAPDLMHLKQMSSGNYNKNDREGVSGFVESINALDSCLTAGKRKGEASSNSNRYDNNYGNNNANREVLLTRQCGGMCFDVCPSDSAIYVVGTEDGSVFQCNKSQTESYDLEYTPHAELVYRIRWSPYSDRFFLTCSADWTTRLYRLGTSSPLIRFDSPNQDAVQDVAWSYTNSLNFATVSAHGNVELWMVMDSIYPRSTISYGDKRRLSCILFAEQENPVIVVGDEEGDVTVFTLPLQLYGRQSDADDEQEEWLNEAIQKQAC